MPIIALSVGLCCSGITFANLQTNPGWLPSYCPFSDRVLYMTTPQAGMTANFCALSTSCWKPALLCDDSDNWAPQK